MNATVLTESCKVALDDKKSSASGIISDALVRVADSVISGDYEYFTCMTGMRMTARIMSLHRRYNN